MENFVYGPEKEGLGRKVRFYAFRELDRLRDHSGGVLQYDLTDLLAAKKLQPGVEVAYLADLSPFLGKRASGGPVRLSDG